MIKWDAEMMEMKAKLDSLLEDNYVMYDLKTNDYKFFPKSEGKPIGYDKWHSEYLSRQKSNELWKRRMDQRIRDRKRRKRKREDAPILICKVCGYKTQTYFPGAFNQHHNENCRFKK